jgi:hypothetical protein
MKFATLFLLLFIQKGAFSPNFKACINEDIERLSMQSSEEDAKWCRWTFDPLGGGVIPHQSWGALKSAGKRKRYVDSQCELRKSGYKDPSCNSVWGDEMVQHWRTESKELNCMLKGCYDYDRTSLLWR